MTQSQKSTGLSPNVFLFGGISFILIIVGFKLAKELAWKCDDIFVTLRYVKNWLNGDGIVYNKGEYVEGYTHFLWMLFITFFQKIGYDPVKTSINLGLFSYLLTYVVWAWNSFKSKSIFPITLLALAVHYEFNIWATSGLETMFYTFMLSLAIAVAFFTELKFNLKLIITGIILYLNVLVRPDGVLFVATGTLIYLLHAVIEKKDIKTIIKEGLILNAGFFAIFIPFICWKIAYYGDVFPNTYYAKSGGGSNFEKGFIYLESYFSCYWTSLIWIPSIVIAFLVALKKDSISQIVKTKDFQVMGALAVVILVYVFGFIARVGGDFMYARFMIPLVPIFYYLIELGLVVIIREINLPTMKAYGLVALLALVSFYPTKSAKEQRDEYFFTENDKGKIEINQWNGIIDERYYYTNHYVLDLFTKIGKQMKDYFDGIPVNVLQRGDCCMSYYAEFDYVLENFGLTDSTIAHTPLKENASKGKVGHQRSASLDYIEQRNIHFCFQRSAYVNKKYRFVAFKLANGRNYRAEMFHYDKSLIEKLSARAGKNFIYTNFEKYVDQYLAITMQSQEKEAIKEAYDEFNKYYFQHNTDKKTVAQKEALLAYLTSL